MDDNVDFCIISPTAGLERYATLSKTHLVLSTEWTNEAYRNFYKACKAAGDFIILDNGAYENGTPKEDCWFPIQDLEPDVVVLPDYFLQPWQKTWHAAIAWLDRNVDVISGFEVCYIPQAEKGDLHGFLESYNEAVQDPRITWLGIPRALATAITDNPLMRVEFARMVKRDHPTLKLHAFGMVNGDVHELGYLASAGVTSVDSSAPVWRGWSGRSINYWGDREAWDNIGTAVDFNAPDHNPLNTCCIHTNLEACGVRIPTR
jgi:hypothetical protein